MIHLVVTSSNNACLCSLNGVAVRIKSSLVKTVSQRPRHRHRPLSRRLDRCDRMIQNESRYSNGGNVRLFTAATCTSQCKLRSLRTHARLSSLLYSFREYSLALDCNGVFAIKAFIAIAPATNAAYYIDYNVTAGLRAPFIRRTCVVSLVFRQHVETNVNPTGFRARLSLSKYCLQHTSTIDIYRCQSGHH